MSTAVVEVYNQVVRCDHTKAISRNPGFQTSDGKIVNIQLEFGHKAALRRSPSAEGFTHDWIVFVRGSNGNSIDQFVEKVEFHLHPTFPKPRRVVKEAPYQVVESGYGGFTLPIDIYLKNNTEPKKIRFLYELFLGVTATVSHNRCEKITFENPSEQFYARLIQSGGTIETALEVGEIVAVETNEVMTVSVESSSAHPKRRGILAGIKKIPVVDENVEPNSQVHPGLPNRTHCVQAIVENVLSKESSIPSTDKNSLKSTNRDNKANVVASKENALAFKDFTCAGMTNCKQTTLANKGNFIACNVNMSKNNALSKESTGNFRKENAASVDKENFAMASNRSPIPRMKIVSTKDKKIKEIVTLANRPAEIPSVTNRPFPIPPVTNNPVRNRPLPNQPVTKSLVVSTNVEDSEQIGMKCFEDAIKSNPAMSSTPIKRCRIEESENGQHPLAPPAKKYNPIMFSTPIKQFNIEKSVKGPHPPAPPAKKSNPIMSSTPIKRFRMEELAKDQHPLAPPAKKSNLRMRFKPYVEEFSVDDDEEVVLSRDAYAKLGGQLPEPLRPRVAYQFSGTQIRPQAVLVASKLRQPMVPMKTARLASLKDSKVKKLPEKSSQGRVTHSQQSEVIARPISNLVTTKEIAKETSSHNKQDDANRNTMSRHLPNVVEQNVGHLSNGGCKIEFSPSHSQENVNPNVPTTGVKQEQSNMDARPEVATDGDSVALLLELQRKLMSLTDRDILQQVVQIIEGTGKYRLNKSTFDFDLCKLDRATVKQLHVCLS